MRPCRPPGLPALTQTAPEVHLVRLKALEDGHCFYLAGAQPPRPAPWLGQEGHVAPGLGNTHKLPAVRVEAPLTLPATLPTTEPPHMGAAPPTPGPLASDWFSQPDPRQPGPSQDSRKAFLLSETMGRGRASICPWTQHPWSSLLASEKADDHIRAPCRHIPQLTSKAQALVLGLRPEGGNRGSAAAPCSVLPHMWVLGSWALARL